MNTEHADTAGIREFHLAVGHPAPEAITEPTEFDRLLRGRLLIEEAFEAAEALGVMVIANGYPVDRREFRLEIDPEAVPYDVTELAKELADVVVVTKGAAVTLGIPIDAVTAEVNRSNLSKLGEDGKPILREDGKVLKSDRYTPPDVAAVITAAS